MPMRRYRSRLHLLVARSAPTVVVLQRKRAKLFHVLTIDTRRHIVEHGSWFRGKLYPLRCDVSFDGRYMAYLALGSRGNTWNGICRPPWLTTLFDAANIGTWNGGGYFESAKVLRTNSWIDVDDRLVKRAGVPLRLQPYASRFGGEDLGVVYERLMRDGFQRLADDWGTHRRLPTPRYQIAQEGDAGWGRQCSRRSPILKVRYAGYLEHGYTFQFWLDEHPALLADASWANWDCEGNLWVTRPGVVEQYTPRDLTAGTPSFVLDVEPFEPPVRPAAGEAGAAPRARRSGQS